MSFSRYDKQLQQIDGTLSTIEMQREALEGANTNTAVLKTMNDAAKALKTANNDLDVDKVMPQTHMLSRLEFNLELSFNIFMQPFSSFL